VELCMSQTLALFSLSIRTFSITGVREMVFINTMVIWKSIINNECAYYLGGGGSGCCVLQAINCTMTWRHQRKQWKTSVKYSSYSGEIQNNYLLKTSKEC
jgi:hypothetical protein